MRDRRREIRDERCSRTALGEHALGGIVGCVEVQVRKVADETIRPALLRKAYVLAGMNSSAPWVPKWSTACALKPSRM